MHNHVCKKCSKIFSSPRNKIQYCSVDCRGFANRTTAEQYACIDDNLPLYLNRLLYKHNNVDGKSRVNLTREHLMGLWQKQDGLCAFSGLPMTCRANRGQKFPYNTSIDRIIPGGPYALDNIQLVCTAVNSLMKNFSKEDILHLCLAATDKHISGINENGGIENETMNNQQRAAFETMKAWREARDTHWLNSEEYKEADKQFKKARAEYCRIRD